MEFHSGICGAPNTYKRSKLNMAGTRCSAPARQEARMGPRSITLTEYIRSIVSWGAIFWG